MNITSSFVKLLVHRQRQCIADGIVDDMLDGMKGEAMKHVSLVHLFVHGPLASRLVH